MDVSQPKELSLVDLDQCVLDALALFARHGVPKLDLGHFQRPLVVGSGNAIATGRILFADKDVIAADESTYQGVLEAAGNVDGAIVISASGGKHAPAIVQALQSQELDVRLLTCNPEAEAKKSMDPQKVYVLPKQAEPYTYNTSTYMSMIIGKTQEDPNAISDFIRSTVDVALQASGHDLGRFQAFFVLVPEEFDLIRIMIKTKFVELFGRRFGVDVFTVEQAKHATTVVAAENELFISFGVNPNEPFEQYDGLWGANRLAIPLPEHADFAAMMAIGYYIVGKIQAAKPPWFKRSIASYCKKASEIFAQRITPLVS